jgi:hypothetical protein
MKRVFGDILFYFIYFYFYFFYNGSSRWNLARNHGGRRFDWSTRLSHSRASTSSQFGCRHSRSSLQSTSPCTLVPEVNRRRFPPLQAVETEWHAARCTQLLRRVASISRDWPDQALCARAHVMEKTNLTYNANSQLVICIGHGYCVAPKSLKHHLNSLHEVKGERLHVALAEVNTLQATTSPVSSRRPSHS